MIYQLYKTKNSEGAYTTLDDGRFVGFEFNPDNTDYQQYLKWVEEGNTPLPADSQPTGENNEGAA
jgi:hypothetical protein